MTDERKNRPRQTSSGIRRKDRNEAVTMKIVDLGSSIDVSVRLSLREPLACGNLRGYHLLWRESDTFKTVNDLDIESLGSAGGPSGGVLSVRLIEVHDEVQIEELAMSLMSGRNSEIVHGRWQTHPAAWVEWSDGLSQILTMVVRLTSKTALLLEYGLSGKDPSPWFPFSTIPAASLLGSIDRVEVTEVH